MQRAAVAIALVLSALPHVSCGGSTPPASTPAPTTPAPTDPSVPNLAGTWTGTIESTEFAARPISAQFVQSVDCVDGAWKTTETGWSGAFSGFALANNTFGGFVSFEGSLAGSGLCPTATRVTGSASTSAIKWTTVSDGNCDGGKSQTVTFVLRKPS
jgi:hypothetical protein